MEFLKLPFFDAIADAETILLAGCGGGYDIFCGLPLYFGLRAAGKTVHLANLSFSPLASSTGRELASGLVQIEATTTCFSPYFPEWHLSRWFATRGEKVPIYCFERVGVLPLMAAYQALVNRVQPDAVLLVDGGTDSLMRGDEVELGTPQEDIASVAAVSLLEVPIKLLVCLGFGIDTYHGVCHAQFLEAVADLTREGGFLGAWTLTREMPEAQRYREACDYVFSRMPSYPSIVSTSILSAVEGQFGDYHATSRTQGSTLFINALMTLYWGFRLEAVARRNLYLDDISGTNTYQDLTEAIVTFRARLKNIKPWQSLPM